MIVLGIILLIFALLFSLYASVDLKYADGKFDYCIRYSFIKILWSGKPEKEKKKKSGSDKKKKKGSDQVSDEADAEGSHKSGRKKKKKNSLNTFFDNLEPVIEFVRSSADSVLWLTKRIRFSDICVDFTVADEDAYSCAVNYGLVNAGVYNILGFLAAYFRTDIDHVNIGLKYNNNNSIYDLSMSLKLRLGTAAAAAAGVLISYIRMQLGMTREKENKNINQNSKECTDMEKHPVNGLMGTAIEKIREMIDVNTIIGNPITTPEGATIIPVSKVSFGFASGGSDLPSKQPKELFGGAAGAGVSVQPLAFICVSPSGDVKLLQMSVNATKENAMISTLPDIIDKISELVNGGEKKEKVKVKKSRAKAKVKDDTVLVEEKIETEE